MPGRVQSHPPKGQRASAPPHDAIPGTRDQENVPYISLEPYMHPDWQVPDLASDLGDFGFPAYQTIGNRVYLYGQLEFVAEDDSAVGGQTVLINLPTSIRPQTTTPVRLYTNTVSSSNGLWGPGYWDAVVFPNGSLVITGAVDLPSLNPQTDEGVVVILEGFSWIKSTGAEIPVTEELDLSPFVSAGGDFEPLPGDTPKLVRRGQHINLEGSVRSLVFGGSTIISPNVMQIPEEWRPVGFTRSLIGVSGPFSGYTHWYGTAGFTFGELTVNGVLKYGSTWHWDNPDLTTFKIGTRTTLPAPGFYSGVYETVGEPPTGTDVLLVRDRFTYRANIALDDLEGASDVVGIVFNVQGSDGYSVEWEEQPGDPDRYRLRLYRFNATGKALLSQRQNIPKPGFFQDQAEVQNLTIDVWWEFEDEGNESLGQRVFITVSYTNFASTAMTFDHNSLDTVPALPGPGGNVGTLNVLSHKTVATVPLYNDQQSIGFASLGDVLTLVGSWNGSIVAPVQPGDVRAGLGQRGVVVRPQTGTPV